MLLLYCDNCVVKEMTAWMTDWLTQLSRGFLIKPQQILAKTKTTCHQLDTNQQRDNVVLKSR